MVYLTMAWARYMSDPFNLERFLAAQTPCYEQVLTELSEGRKQTHWMWFIFPQAIGLGNSSASRLYAIQSTHEAQAYLAHPILGFRLLQCTKTVLNHRFKPAQSIFGYPDVLKFHSSMTLFHLQDPEQKLFKQALDDFYRGRLDDNTKLILNK